jgi:histone chaperone ASF1
MRQPPVKGVTRSYVERWARPICWQADPPNVEKIPQDSIIGVTVVLLSCAYKSREFARVGYYVNNDYADPEMRENPPEKIDYSKVCWFCASLLSFNGPGNKRAHTLLASALQLVRNILTSKPCVTRFDIEWC